MLRKLALLATAVLAVAPLTVLGPSQAQARPDRSSMPSFGTALVGKAPTGHGPAATAYDATTDTIYVANGFAPNKVPNPGGNTVSVIDGRHCDARRLPAVAARGPPSPSATSRARSRVDPAHHTVYVANSTDGTVSVVNAGTARAATPRAAATVATRDRRGRPRGSVRRRGPAHAVRRELRDQHRLADRHRHLQRPAPAAAARRPRLRASRRPTARAASTSTSGPTRRTSPPCWASTPSTPARATPPPSSGCGDLGSFPICDGCFGSFDARVDESTNTIYEGDGDQKIVAVDGRSCNADDLEGCATAPFGTVDLHGPGFAHVLSLVVDETRHSVYVLSHKDDVVVMIDATTCNGRNTDGCATLVPEFVHTGTNPAGHRPRRAHAHRLRRRPQRRRPVGHRRPAGAAPSTGPAAGDSRRACTSTRRSASRSPSRCTRRTSPRATASR